MSVYRMDDGRIVDTTKASQRWEESTFFNGNNHISRATGSQWNHETLFQSAKGSWYIEATSQWQGSSPNACWVTPSEAAVWLLANEHEVPPELAEAAAEVSE